MRFHLQAYDYTDEHSLTRRLEVRPVHLEKLKPLKANGHFILGGALLSEQGTMIGSVMILDFPNRNDLNT
ncbi:MAG: YciI family protein [Siphonobacter sp.]